MTKTELATILAPLSVIFDRTLDAPLINTYFIALEEVPDELLKASVTTCIRECHFFPTPAELIERARVPGRGSVKDRALDAWVEVCKCADSYTSVDVHDSAMAATIEAMGGWIALHSDEREPHWVQKDFLKWYEHYADCGPVPKGITHFAGRHELNNIDYPDRAPKTRSMQLGVPKRIVLTSGKKAPKEIH